MKEKIKYFFFETTVGKWLYRSMAVLNGIEGIVHLVIAAVGTFGVIQAFGPSFLSTMFMSQGLGDAATMWAIMAPNIENFIFGIFSILVGLALGVADHEQHKNNP